MLVDQSIPRQVEDHLDIAVQLKAPLVGDHSVQLRHGMPPFYRIGPQKDRDLHRVGIFRHGEPGILMAGADGHAAGPAAGDPHIAGKTGQEDGSSCALLAVSVALGPIALDQRRRAGQGIAAGQAADRLRLHAGDGFRPLGGLLHPVLLSHQPGTIAQRRVHTLWHMFFIKAQTVPVQKILVL